ncbi:MAG: hypothetical protein JWP51_4613 [Bradyrhizobium sp.]|jgi:hypothetical protein|nr:hypothetical protein [Bradyrhizobium sp.]
MSRHHMLPPIVYVPQPKPRKIENRKSRIQARSADRIEDSGDVEETYQPLGPTRSALAGNTRLESFPPIEGLERNPRSPAGPLSEDTLKVMLLAQELEQRHGLKDPS